MKDVVVNSDIKTAVEYENMRHYHEDFPNASEDPNNSPRLPQKAAYNCVVDKLVNQGKKSASIVLPTGVGKSDVVLSLAVGLSNRGHCAGALVFSPHVGLRNQLVNVKSCEGFLKRIGQNQNYTRSPFTWESDIKEARNRFKDGENKLQSWTIQKLTTGNSVNDFIDYAKRIKKDTGLWPVVIIDESHLLSDDNCWGSQVKKLHDAGMSIVLVTGTPYRSDNTGIPFFNYVKISEINRPATKTEVLSADELLIKKGVIRGTEYRLEADYEYGYKEAINKGYILNPVLKYLDAKETKHENELLSKMSKSTSKKALRYLLTDDSTIAHAVKQTLSYLDEFGNASALITTLSDQDNNSDDHHAKKIKQEIFKQDPSKTVLISTHHSDDPEVLEKFRVDKKYDILIVKTQASIGYDCPRIKVITNLSNYRQLPSFTQLIMRGCRNFKRDNGKPYKHFIVIAPKDPSMVELVSQFREDTGLLLEEVDFIVQEEYEAEITEENCEIYDPRFENHQTSSFVEEEYEENEKLIHELRKEFPGISAEHTPDEMVEKFRNINKTLYSENNIIKTESEHQPKLLDTKKEAEIRRSKIQKTAKEIANYLCKKNHGEYGKEIKTTWVTIKKQSGWRGELKTITNLETLDNTLIVAERLHRKIVPIG